jgi:exopolysaccharide production protein ExoY
MKDSAEVSSDLEFVSAAKDRPVGLSSKRLLDVAIALSAILLLAPLLIICFTLTAISSRGAPVFRHRRVGFNGKHFSCFKFRTMVPDASERLNRLLEADPAAAKEWQTSRKLRHDPRVTAIGTILRKSSLDELPQLFNVLKGDMSIVGPRPVTEDELAYYAAATTAYFSCRPGITGLWQVSGRSTTTYDKRIACDTFYARNWSMALDVRILVITIPALLSSDGAY